MLYSPLKWTVLILIVPTYHNSHFTKHIYIRTISIKYLVLIRPEKNIRIIKDTILNYSALITIQIMTNIKIIWLGHFIVMNVL